MATIQYDLSRNSVSFINSNIVNTVRAAYGGGFPFNSQYTINFSNFGNGHFEVYSLSPGTSQNFGAVFVQVLGGNCIAFRNMGSSSMDYAIDGTGNLKIYTSATNVTLNCCIIEKI